MTRPSMRFAAFLAGCLLHAGVVAADTPAGPQRSTADAPAASQPGAAALSWLSSYRFHLSAASLGAADPRFDWDAHFGGDIDLLDYGFGRVNLLADYGVVIGSQIRAIDPNQGEYHLAVSASWRHRAVEVQPVFDHVSRHLSDRSNEHAVSWNGVGALVLARRERGALSTVVNARVTRIVQAAFVDYTWQLGAGIESTYRFSPRGSVVARADLTPMLVDPQVAGRATQVGLAIEGGVRLFGPGAGLELFAGWQRRIDPWPLERSTLGFPMIGFRFLSR